MYSIEPDLTKEFILETIPQEELFQYYGHIHPDQGVVRNPLRADSTPSCKFSWYNGRLWLRDWTETHPMDCFTLVQRMNGCNFQGALEIIARDFGPHSERKIELSEQMKSKRRKKEIQVKRGEFSASDYRWMRKYLLNPDICRFFNIHHIDNVWLDGVLKYSSTYSDPALGYYFGSNEDQQRWKIYFYLRQKPLVRFIANTSRINGWIQLPEKGDILLLTKSLKDVACLYRFGLTAVAMQGESTIPYPRIIDELTSRFSIIYSLYDYDPAGIESAGILHKEYGIPSLFLTPEYLGPDDYPKDFSDYVAAHGKEKTQTLVQRLYDYISSNSDPAVPDKSKDIQ